MADYLFRRNGRYSYRRRYPTEVAAFLGRAEFVKALGTADPVLAKRLSPKVSVEFDNACAEALLSLAKSSAEPQTSSINETPSPTNAELAKRVLDSLPGVIAKITESTVAEQARNPNWLATVEWQKRALKEHIAGQMPMEIAMHPLEARTALKALEAAARGEPLSMHAASINSPRVAVGTSIAPPEKASPIVNREQLNAALSEYSYGKSHRRKALAQRHAFKVLTLPCSQEVAVDSISKWCNDELTKEKKPSSVWTEASAVIALLKHVPGWHGFEVPKVGALKRLKGAGKARQDARAPMSVPLLHGALRNLPQHLPRGGGYWHATLLLCALYGLRPGELLQSGPEALQQRTDVFDEKRLVFKVGLNGAKNVSSKRDLPVSDELRPLFELALSMGSCNSETARTRVDRLNRLVKKAHGSSETGLTLYTVRHLFADVARACNYRDDQIGPIMGHASKAEITRVYGGKAPLDFNAELLSAVQLRLFPNGLSEFWPNGLDGCPANRT
jgi:integrase